MLVVESLDLLSGQDRDNAVLTFPEAGRCYDRAELKDLCHVFDSVIATARQKLSVLIIADLSAVAIAAYLECLRTGHAAILLDSRFDHDKRSALLESFRPDVVVLQSSSATAHPMSADYDVGGTIGAHLVLRRRQSEPPVPHPQLAVLIATSGSLGAFRLVCLTYSGLGHNGSSIAAALGLLSTDRAALSLSMGYSYGLSILNSHLISGGSVAILKHAPTSLDHWRLFDLARCTAFAAVPETYRLLDAARHDLAGHPTLRLATQAGGRLAETLVRRFGATLSEAGREFAVMYGQTEATARIACHKGAEVLEYPRSVGRAIPGVGVRIEDSSGRAVADGLGGQIVVSGPGTMLGYAHRREDLADLPDRPIPTLHTGDLGYLSGGRLHVTGRLTRFAKPIGVRIQLDEVEEFFSCIGPAAAVCDNLERIIVYVERPVVDYRAAYREVLRTYVLPPAMLRVQQVTTIPRTVSGKVAYNQLSNWFEAL